MKKITIINAYGDKNIGDAAILTVALKFVYEAYGNNIEVSVLCEDKKSFSKFIDYSKNAFPLQLPYGYAIHGNKQVSTAVKIFRFLLIYFVTFFLVFTNKILNFPLIHEGFFSYIYHIKHADVVVGMGGGYFTTNQKYSDYFGLLLSLITVYVAKAYNRKIVFLPISFGPFASRLQEKISINALKDTTVISRDNITLNIIKKLDKDKRINTFYAPDLALFLTTEDAKKKINKSKKHIILTAREWFSDSKKQQKYENALTRFVEKIKKDHNIETIFVPMGRNPIEDDDHRVALRIKRNLKDPNIMKLVNPKSMLEIRDLLKDAHVAVCTRMHSAILSCTVNTPFIAIGYGHKTLGFVKSFNLEKWHIDINAVTYENLLTKFNLLLMDNNYFAFKERVNNKMNEIQKYKKIILGTLT